MADKPRLKEADEILDSISVKTHGDPDAGKRSGPEWDAGEQDRRPLDFGKYELPAKHRKKEEPVLDEDDEEIATPLAVEIFGAEESAPAPVAASGPTEPETEPRPVQWEVLASQEIPTAAEPVVEAPPMAPGQPGMASVLKDAGQVEAFSFADLEELQPEEAQTREDIPAQAEKSRPESEPEETPVLLDKEAETRRKLVEDDHYRDDVLKEISSKFEEAFNREFEKDLLGGSPEEKKQKSDPPKQESRKQPDREHSAPAQPAAQPKQEPAVPVEQEPARVRSQAEREADQFLRSFEEKARQEAPASQPDFKETLAQKFMRERERYLEELGIAEKMEEEHRREQELKAQQEQLPLVEPPARRRLELKIRPEMHMQAGDPPIAPPTERPVTYTRQAALHPQTGDNPAGGLAIDRLAAEETGADSLAGLVDSTPAVRMNLSSGTKAGGSKSAEQLLLELAAANRRQSPRRAAGPAQNPSELKFKFTTPEEAAKEQEKLDRKYKRRKLLSTPFRKTVAVSALCGLLVLSLVAGSVIMLNRPTDIVEDPNVALAALPGGDLWEAYESFNPDNQTRFSDVIVKRTGISLSNLTVDNSLVVEEEAAAAGKVTLQNIMVGDMIYIKSSGADTVDLRDVHAQKLIINNGKSSVNLLVSGASDISSVELRTPTVIEQTGLTEDSPGLRTVSLRNGSDEGQPISLDLKQTQLPSLTTSGQAVLTFDGSAVERLSADGSFSLSGTGKVQTLFAGVNMGGGATDALPEKPVSIQIRDVEIGHFDIKSPADIDLSTMVETAATGDSVNLRGAGSIGTLTLNEKTGTEWLGIPVSGLKIQQLIANAQAKIQCLDTAAINILIANKTTYALGNKVNHLKVNESGVIYEQEPDIKTIAQGIAPPQSKADNPNLNYDLNVVTQVTGGGSTDVSGDGVATTCGHAREVGGFTKGNGSKDSPFIVETPRQLAHVAEHLGSHFTQSGDIDIADDSSYAAGFPMIGGRFYGVYDGAGYSIANLRILTDGENIGLFAENTGTIRNVHITSGEINGGSRAFVGAITGFNYQGGVVESSSNGASVSALQSTYAGGIVGYNYGGKIKDCYNTAKVNGGSVVGGIVGMNRPGSGPTSVTGSYNIGVVEGDSSVGGVAGSNEDAVITNCYYLDSAADRGIGTGEGTAVGKSSQQLGTTQAAADLAAGNENSLWQPGVDGYPYPTLKSSTYTEGTIVDPVPAESSDVAQSADDPDDSVDGLDDSEDDDWLDADNSFSEAVEETENILDTDLGFA